MRIWSIGHGTRTLADLLAILGENEIRTLADIRSFPGSRRYPHFGKGSLAVALSTAGIRYEHLRGLGGRRRAKPGSPHTALRVPAFRAYADHMESAEFRSDLDRLEALAREAPTAYMCAETLWWRCHRRLLSDRLVADSWVVVHILALGKTERHRMWELARLDGQRLVYDAAPSADRPPGPTGPRSF